MIVSIKMDLALNNLQKLICYKTQLTQNDDSVANRTGNCFI